MSYLNVQKTQSGYTHFFPHLVTVPRRRKSLFGAEERIQISSFTMMGYNKNAGMDLISDFLPREFFSKH